jgi:hypothetical protein
MQNNNERDTTPYSIAAKYLYDLYYGGKNTTGLDAYGRVKNANKK